MESIHIFFLVILGIALIIGWLFVDYLFFHKGGNKNYDTNYRETNEDVPDVEIDEYQYKKEE